MLEKLTQNIGVYRRSNDIVIFGRKYEAHRGQRQFSKFLAFGAGIVVSHDELEKLVTTLRLILAHDTD